MSAVYESSLTPMTNMGASAEGAEMMTFLAPPEKRINLLKQDINYNMPLIPYSTKKLLLFHNFKEFMLEKLRFIKCDVLAIALLEI